MAFRHISLDDILKCSREHPNLLFMLYLLLVQLLFFFHNFIKISMFKILI